MLKMNHFLTFIIASFSIVFSAFASDQTTSELVTSRGKKNRAGYSELWTDTDRQILIRKSVTETGSRQLKEATVHRVLLRLPSSQNSPTSLQEMASVFNQWADQRIPQAPSSANACSRAEVTEYFSSSHIAVLSFCSPASHLRSWTAEDQRRLTSLSMDHWDEMKVLFNAQGVEVIEEILIRVAL